MINITHGVDPNNVNKRENSEHSLQGKHTTSGYKGCEGESHDGWQSKGYITKDHENQNDSTLEDQAILQPVWNKEHDLEPSF